MAHPKMFSDDDPMLARVREIALALPDAKEKVSHGRPAFYTTKVFAYFGASVKVDREWVQHDQALLVLLDEVERAALAADPRSFLPAYLGAYGWIGLDLHDNTDWDEMAELVEMSYRQTAGPRRVATLDALRPA